MNLAGAYFTGAMIFTFGNVTLEPGARILVVEDTAAFATAYGATPVVAGQWTGALDNTADTIILRSGINALIDSVSYSEAGEWPAPADGDGSTLVRINPLAPPIAANWRSSTAVGGNPGTTDSIAFTGTALADADHDGISALLEYFYGTSDAAAGPSPLNGGRTAEGKAKITFSRRIGTDDLALIVEVSTDLASWQPAATRIAHTTNGSTATETWSANTPAPQQFMRLRVVK